MSEEEFKEDLKTLRSIKILFRKHITGNSFNQDTLLNHFIYLINCFGSEEAVLICFHEMEDYYFPFLKTVFVSIGVQQFSSLQLTKEKHINYSEIPVDLSFLEILKKGNHRLCR